MKMRSILVGAGLLALAACSNPFAVGPGRVAIKLDEATVRSVPHEVLFPDSSRDRATPEERDALVFVISSETELLSYFREQGRELQVRCAVEGNKGNRSYEGFAVGPVPAGQVKSQNAGESAHQRYRYSIYAFIDLRADDVVYEQGMPATTLDLRTGRFTALKCHLLGVTKAPVLFPRSNDVLVTFDTFRSLLSKATRVGPNNSSKPTPLRGAA